MDNNIVEFPYACVREDIETRLYYIANTKLVTRFGRLMQTIIIIIDILVVLRIVLTSNLGLLIVTFVPLLISIALFAYAHILIKICKTNLILSVYKSLVTDDEFIKENFYIINIKNGYVKYINKRDITKYETLRIIFNIEGDKHF